MSSAKQLSDGGQEFDRPELDRTAERRPISGIRRQVVKHLKFFNGTDGSLIGLEFEGPPISTVLHVICGALASHNVCIADSATRITANSLYQRFVLSELDGRALLGNRRQEVQNLFFEALELLAAEPE